MEKIVNPGSGPDGHVFCRIHYSGKPDGRLSITGVVGPMRNGDARGSCGQIVGHLARDVTTFSAGWSADLLARFEATWERWHLNDMRAGCEHQRAWNVGEELTLRPLTWGPEYHRRREAAANGRMRADEFVTWGETVSIVGRLTMGFYPPKHPDKWGADGERMLALDLVKEEKPDVKAAGWVTEAEHPSGLLSKPCQTCGHKYGSGWLKEEVPADVLAFLESLPVSALTPAWV